MNISLADQRSQTVTLDEVTAQGTLTFRRMIEDFGYDDCLRVVNRLVMEADIALGGDGDPSRCVPTAANALIGNGHRGIGFLVVSIREGMKGKVYGNKITAPLLNEWTTAQEAIIIGMAESEHSRNVVKNDNLGRDYMEREQHNAEVDKRKISRMSDHIENLKAKLDEKREH